MVASQTMRQLKHFASFPQTGVSLKRMVEHGQDTKAPQVSLLRSAMFLQNELPIRLAKRALELESSPHDLCKMQSVIAVKNWYIKSFEEIVQYPKLELPSSFKARQGVKDECSFEKELSSEMIERQAQFVNLIDSIKTRHNAVLSKMAQGILELKRSKAAKDMQPVDDDVLQSFLDRFYLSRTGIRMLIGQHVAIHESLTNPSRPQELAYIGLICPETPLERVARDAINNATLICESHYGPFTAPRVDVKVCQEGIRFPYVPSHLHHMIFELVKNSMRAVCDRFGPDNDEKPPICVIVAVGSEDVTIKIADEGGGIPRSEINKVWRYSYTTAEYPVEETDESKGDFRAPLAGYGYGLPISRLYARYFGGDLKLISMEGYGTDAFLHLLRLSDSSEALPNESWA